MLLTPNEANQFFKLHRTLMFYVNERLKVLPDKLATPEEFALQPPESRLKVRNALLDETDLIESFVDDNATQFSEEERDIVLSWRHLVDGHFYIFRESKKFTIFLSAEDQPIAYGVTALTQPFEELVGAYLPVMTETVLLPFKDKIVYDGLLAGPGISLSFGRGILQELNKAYQKAKDRYGIVTSLPVSALPVAPKNPSKPKKQLSNESRVEDAQGVLWLIVGKIDDFCRGHLNEEYAVLCRKLAEKLARKPSSPLLSGKPNTWACAIVRTIGMINFLGDRSRKPYIKIADISKAFAVGESTASAKSAIIRNLLQISHLDHEWTLPSRMANSPLIWLLSVNGLMMDIRDAPREAQQVAFEKGLIPYIPADRAE